MKITKTLAGILLGATLLTLNGCKPNKNQYIFGGKIKEEQVNFYRKKQFLSSKANILVVTKNNETTIKYVDNYGGNLKLDWVEITSGDTTKIYDEYTDFGKPVIEKAQGQFDDYLKKILEVKAQEGLNNLE